MVKPEGSYQDILDRDHMISHMSSDSSGSLDTFSTSEAASGHTNGRGHAHHYSSPSAMQLEATPTVSAMPTLLGMSHSTIHDSNGHRHNIDHMTGHVTSDPNPVEPSTSTELHPLSDVLDDHTHNKDGHTHNKPQVLTEEAESLFNDLMTSLPAASLDKKISYTDLDWGDPASRSNSFSKEPETPPNDPVWSHGRTDSDTRTISEYASRGSSVDEGSTPRASPYTSPSSIRRWSVRKRRSYDYSDPDEVTTPKSSPYIRRHNSARVKCSSHTSSPGSDQVFSLPVLDPPTQFRNIETLGPSPDELLETSELDREGVTTTYPDYEDKEAEVSLLEEETSNPTPVTTMTAKNCSKKNGERSRPNTLPPDIPFHSNDTLNPIPIEPHSTSTADLHSLSKKPHSSSMVKRSHSFGNNKHLLVIHKREGSLSTDNSPLPSPKFRGNQSDKHQRSPNSASDITNHQRTKGSPAPSSPVIMSLMAAQRVEQRSPDIPLIHVDPSIAVDLEGVASSPGAASTHSLILPPPLEFKGSPDHQERSASRASSTGRDDDEHRTEKEERSFFSYFRIKHSKRGSRSATPSDLTREDKRVEFSASVDISTEVREIAPVEQAHILSSSSDMMSFDEALESYDQYASQTGKTARSTKHSKVAKEAIIVAPSPPPPSSSPSTQERGKKDEKKKKSKKKKKRHGYTVANIDSNTMKEVQRDLARKEEARKTSDSHVQQLAREYSQRIKDRNKLHKKYSTVFEESSAAVAVGEDPGTPEPGRPEWLTQLSEKRRMRSADDILEDDFFEEDECSSIGSNGADLGEPRPLPRPQSDDDIPASFAQLRIENGNRTRQRHTLGGVNHHRVWVEEEVKTGRLKGWVRSLAAKFVKKEGTTL